MAFRNLAVELDPNLADFGDANMLFVVGSHANRPLLIVGRVALYRVFTAFELRVPNSFDAEKVPEGRLQVYFRIAKRQTVYFTQPVELHLECCRSPVPDLFRLIRFGLGLTFCQHPVVEEPDTAKCFTNHRFLLCCRIDAESISLIQALTPVSRLYHKKGNECSYIFAKQKKT